MSISTLILTLDEEENLPTCLASLAWCDDVVVLDSLSTDETESIAQSFGARFVQRPFDDYTRQRNFGLHEIDYRHAWVLMVDADEQTPPDLVAEMKSLVECAPASVTLAHMRRKDMFLGKWMRRSSGYPTWFGRLGRSGRVRSARAINEEYLTDGQSVRLQHHLIHNPFNKGFEAWFAKHNRYSSMEVHEKDATWLDMIVFRDLLCMDPVRRRRAQKALAFRLPLRPVAVFLALYVGRAGFLDGSAGLRLCLLRAFYEFMIDCKALEKKRREARLPI